MLGAIITVYFDYVVLVVISLLSGCTKKILKSDNLSRVVGMKIKLGHLSELILLCAYSWHGFVIKVFLV